MVIPTLQTSAAVGGSAPLRSGSGLPASKCGLTVILDLTGRGEKRRREEEKRRRLGRSVWSLRHGAEEELCCVRGRGPSSVSSMRKRASEDCAKQKRISRRRESESASLSHFSREPRARAPEPTRAHSSRAKRRWRNPGQNTEWKGGAPAPERPPAARDGGPGPG